MLLLLKEGVRLWHRCRRRRGFVRRFLVRTECAQLKLGSLFLTFSHRNSLSAASSNLSSNLAGRAFRERLTIVGEQLNQDTAIVILDGRHLSPSLAELSALRSALNDFRN